MTDLESYTMASEETINAKFEAFEARMEDKIRTLLIEFSLGRPPSPKKSHKERALTNHIMPEEMTSKRGEAL